MTGQRGRPPKSGPKVAPARAGKAGTSDAPAKYDRDGIDANNILKIKRKIKKRPYDNVTGSDEAANTDVPVKPQGKKTRFDIDTEYENNSAEDFEEPILDAVESDDVDEPLTPVKPAKGSKTYPDPKEITIHVPHLNGKGNEVVARFYVAFTIQELQEVIKELFHHIDIRGIDINTLPSTFWYRTSSDKIKTQFKLDDDGDWLQLKDDYAKVFKKKKGDATAFVYFPDEFTARLHGTQINIKNGRTAAGAHKGATGHAEDPDVKARDALKDNAVGLTEEIRALGDELKVILKKCQRHATPDGLDMCHVDKAGKHYIVNYNQCRVWQGKLGTGKVTVYRPLEVACFAGWEEGPALPEAYLPPSRNGAVAPPEAPEAITAGLQQAPQIVYLPSPFGGPQFVPGLSQFLSQMAGQQVNPQNMQYAQFPYGMPQQAFGAAFSYGGTPFGYVPAAPPAPAVPATPPAPEPPAEEADADDPNASNSTINASDIPNPYPTVGAWLEKCEESEKKKTSTQPWDWQGIRAKFTSAFFLDKHINVVLDMGLHQIRDVFGFEGDEAAFLFTKASRSCQRVKTMFAQGLHA